ncbi:hypothetical protein NE237_030054 [Protea cynaroides]|uniref:Uncharacterized protein n=1 Tax=Protea cynaroides TaxID=273540 RepID=A0A9Q0JVP7_9MAGN|nr:hypothetical protein NE237_030054 [Protea cynaroides]
MDENNDQKHFILVHGACHGAWCWFKLETLLTSAGYKVTSLDLATSGIDPKQVEDLHSIADYYEPLMELMASLREDEKKFPEKVSVAVFISAIMPSPTNSVVNIQEEYERIQAKPGMERNYWFGVSPSPDKLAKQYQKSPPEDLTLATKLVRPIGFYGIVDMMKETAVSEEKYGSVKRVFILCDEDGLMKILMSWIIENSPPNEVVKIPGSDHMAMM